MLARSSLPKIPVGMEKLDLCQESIACLQHVLISWILTVDPPTHVLDSVLHRWPLRKSGLLEWGLAPEPFSLFLGETLIDEAIP